MHRLPLGQDAAQFRVSVMKIFAPLMMTAAGLALVAAASSPGRTQTSSPDSQVTVAVVRATKACFTASIRVTGFLVARQEAVVTLDAPGMKITEVLAGEGDRVTAGQTLARLARQSTEGPEPPGARASPTTLKSPVAGVITRSTAMVGATASPMAEPLFRIAVDNEIELEAEVPSIHVPTLAPGQTARIEIGDNRELTGRVRLVPAVIDQVRQLGRARLSLERHPSLRLGMFAGATIDAKRSCGVSIPSAAVHHRTEGRSVQVVRDNVVERRLVQVGLHSDTHTEILDGLREGEMVVANAGSSLRDGDRVKPIVDGARIGQR
jgi:multidrug efflux pump subunit AcrA (membrane-fusion protein)